MSRLYDTVEPAVIDETLLKQCVEEQGPIGEAGKIAKKEGIDFKDVFELRLDFKNILKIDNLWRFTNLVKLQLDNNIIEKMEGLSMLTNLKWLDLSFNNIEVLEGLDQLTKLTDLTLFNNRITSIGNMESLNNLHVLSLGNNKLEQLDALLYLRKFKKLSTLNLHGNPFCNQEEYHAFTVAHLPCLVYLDYRLIDNIKREEAIERYRDSIDELMHDEAVLQRKQAEEEETFAERMIHKEAYVEDLNGPALFHSMFFEDSEASKLAQLPGVSDLLAIYEEKFSKISLKLFEFGLKEREKRDDEKKSFFTCLSDAFERNRNESVRHIENFEKHKTKEKCLRTINFLCQHNYEHKYNSKTNLFSVASKSRSDVRSSDMVLAGLLTVQEQDHIEDKINDLSSEVRTLQDVLMSLELQLVDQLEETMKDFERNMLDMVGTFVENVQEHVSQMRELETQHHEKLSDIAVITLEKLMKNELEEEMSDDVRMLFVDRDTIMNAVSASHDAHTFRIDNKEDDIVTRANTNVQTLIEHLHADEIKRNRGRVNEISNLLDHYQDELDNFESNIGM